MKKLTKRIVAASAGSNPSGREQIGIRREGLAPSFYEEWKRVGPHLEEYASECLGTAFLLFCVVAAVSLLIAKSSPIVAFVPSLALRLFLIGLVLGGAGWLVAISPPGRLSGAHINPALSIGFLALGKMYLRDTIGYIFGQMLGAAIGTWLGSLALGRLAGEVGNAALYARASLSEGLIFAAEVATTCALAWAIYTFVSFKPLARWTPAMATLLVGILVWLDGSFSGCGMNPARWFGPALSIGYWKNALVYVAGPILGALFAAALRRLGRSPQPIPHTAKVFHDPCYRSVFKHDTLPSTPPRRIMEEKR